METFEQMTYSPMWKVLMAKLVEIKTLSTGEKIHIVELVDTNGDKVCIDQSTIEMHRKKVIDYVLYFTSIRKLTR